MSGHSLLPPPVPRAYLVLYSVQAIKPLISETHISVVAIVVVAATAPVLSRTTSRAAIAGQDWCHFVRQFHRAPARTLGCCPGLHLRVSVLLYFLVLHNMEEVLLVPPPTLPRLS